MPTSTTSAGPGALQHAPRPSHPVVVTGHLLVAWCLAFAAVSLWQLVTGWSDDHEYAEHAAGLAAMSAIVLVLKLIGAAVAWRAIRSDRPSWLLAAALWGASSLLLLYSAGNVVITVGVLTGLMEPSVAWQDAGGVTARSVAYLVFFLAAAPMFAAVAVSYQRRSRPRWTACLAGVLGAPLLLGAVLAGIPAVLTAAGWLP